MSLQKKQLPVMKKILILVVLIFIFFAILIFSIINTIEEPRELPALTYAKKDLAVRGNIYSSDNFTIATSRKIYSAAVDTRAMDKDKKELFITLFSIYSNIPKKELRKKLSQKNGYIILSRTIDQKTAKDLKSLAYKLRRLDVFHPIKRNGNTYIHGLDIYEIGEERIYPYKDTLTPVLGYIKKQNSKRGEQRVNGLNGIEREFNDKLNNFQDGLLKGKKDILSYIIFNKDSKIIKRRDGDDIKITIPLKLQKNIELMLDRYKKKFEAHEILVSVMDSTTGKILSLASSNRYNPSHIKPNEIGYLTMDALEYGFEPGSVIKPLSVSLALEHKKVKKNELFYAYNKGKINSKGEFPKGRYKINRHIIHDDHQFKKHYLTLEDIIVYSSNIGALTIANRLSAKQFYNGYLKFGLSKKTGIDLPFESKGIIHKIYQYRVGEDKGKDNIYKATDSYGQGMTATFMQLIKAYSVFNNNGKIVTPYIFSKDAQVQEPQVVSKKVANHMKELLEQTVKKGTGEKARIKGLEIGGKTGTANIVEHGKYQRKYMSSFFGFANDKNHKYTIGVTVNDPVNRGKHWYYYYAASSAVPVFKEVVKILVKLDYLKPNLKY